MADLIRWERASDVTELGFAGTHEPWLFQIWTGGERQAWQLITATSLAVDERPESGDPEELKQRAEEMLREFAASLGALFAADLRKHLELQIATEQSLGDDYSERDQDEASQHWGGALALRDLLKYVNHEVGRMCPGGCGCRLGTDDADRRECGCDEGCCEEEASR
jgi:hypothetical protein